MGNLDDMLANAGIGGDADDYSAPEGFRSGFVSFVGRPNTGKSTLTNALVGEKIAITANQPETTRHPVRGVVHREHCQIVVVDTPGPAQTAHTPGRAAQRCGGANAQRS